jgi:hypothetical protein
MGQYWKPVNIDKKEYIDPHKLGCGLKLWEQLASHPGTGAGLIILTSAMPEARGGGDFDREQNWHGPERTFPEHNITPAEMPEDYKSVAKRTIGRWAGDRIALIGDYAEKDDINGVDASKIYKECNDEGSYTDISDDVVRVIEHELNGKYVGDGWKDWKEDDKK